ncbi:MAG TPA: DUF86 domain-containing protein [Candidatus Sulfomarinibacteraceae bacterium]|nr:DUF86 domain-containing protein [Candidatus Sulfomarinibacteraceae bacterium]
MTPGTVDLKVVGDRLQIVIASLTDLRGIPQGSFDEFVSDRRNPLASDAALRRALEALFDVARHLLAKGKGLAGLEYREVATLAREHGLIQDADLADRFHAMAGYRNRLTHHYEKVTDLELFGIVSEHLGDIEAIAESLRAAASDLAKRS